MGGLPLPPLHSSLVFAELSGLPAVPSWKWQGWAVQLGAQDRGSWFWQPFITEKKKKSSGLAHPDLDCAQSSPTPHFPGGGFLPACSCNLLRRPGAATPFLLSFPEDAVDDSFSPDSYVSLAEQLEAGLACEGIPPPPFFFSTLSLRRKLRNFLMFEAEELET